MHLFSPTPTSRPRRPRSRASIAVKSRAHLDATGRAANSHDLKRIHKFGVCISAERDAPAAAHQNEVIVKTTTMRPDACANIRYITSSAADATNGNASALVACARSASRGRRGIIAAVAHLCWIQAAHK